MSCGVGCRCSSDMVLPWLWCRLAAVVSSSWKLPYATGVALKSKNKTNEQTKKYPQGVKKGRRTLCMGSPPGQCPIMWISFPGAGWAERVKSGWVNLLNLRWDPKTGHILGRRLWEGAARQVGCMCLGVCVSLCMCVCVCVISWAAVRTRRILVPWESGL